MTRKVYREICILRKLSSLNLNIYSVKLIEVLWPKEVETAL